MLTFYVFTPQAGAQHHAWILAMAVLADYPRARLHAIVATISLGIMYVYTPYSGEYFTFVASEHSSLFWSTNMNAHHMAISALVNLPLWIYYIWWLATLLRDVRRAGPIEVSPLPSPMRQQVRRP